MEDPTKYHAGFRFKTRRDAGKFMIAVSELESRGKLLVHDYLILHPRNERTKWTNEFHDASPTGNAMLGALMGAVAGAFIGVAFGVHSSMSNAVEVASVGGAAIGAFLAWLIARLSGMATERVATIRNRHRAGTTVVFLVSHVDDAITDALRLHPNARPIDVATDFEVSRFIDSLDHASAGQDTPGRRGATEDIAKASV